MPDEFKNPKILVPFQHLFSMGLHLHLLLSKEIRLNECLVFNAVPLKTVTLFFSLYNERKWKCSLY